MANTSNATGFWSPSAWYCAEVVHILAGALILVAASLHGFTPWIVLACLLTGAAVKEFGIDLSPFEGDSLWGSCQDFFFYAVGGVRTPLRRDGLFPDGRRGGCGRHYLVHGC